MNDLKSDWIFPDGRTDTKQQPIVNNYDSKWHFILFVRFGLCTCCTAASWQFPPLSVVVCPSQRRVLNQSAVQNCPLNWTKLFSKTILCLILLKPVPSGCATFGDPSSLCALRTFWKLLATFNSLTKNCINWWNNRMRFSSNGHAEGLKSAECDCNRGYIKSRWAIVTDALVHCKWVLECQHWANKVGQTTCQCCLIHQLTTADNWHLDGVGTLWHVTGLVGFLGGRTDRLWRHVKVEDPFQRGTPLASITQMADLQTLFPSINN